MNETKLRWGILGTAVIARKNWQAIRLSGNGIVTAVASRDLGRARQFVAENQQKAPFESAPRALGSYEELLAARDIDAVYLPLPTGMRKQWVIRAAEAGKHVVCEKPCATSVADLREMIDACRRHRVQLMDGVMFMHSNRLVRMKEVLDDATTVGSLHRVTSAFSFRAPESFFADNIRADSTLEPFGCLGDLGWYSLRISLWAAGWRLPHTVSGRILNQFARRDSPAPVPTEFSGELLFEGGLSAGFHCSFITHFHQWLHLDGSLGGLRVDDFVLPAGDEVSFHANGRRIAVPEYGSGHATAQESNLFRNFGNQVRTPALNDSWPDFALKTQQVMNACFASALAGGASVEVD